MRRQADFKGQASQSLVPSHHAVCHRRADITVRGPAPNWKRDRRRSIAQGLPSMSRAPATAGPASRVNNQDTASALASWASRWSAGVSCRWLANPFRRGHQQILRRRVAFQTAHLARCASTSSASVAAAKLGRARSVIGAAASVIGFHQGPQVNVQRHSATDALRSQADHCCGRPPREGLGWWCLESCARREPRLECLLT